MAVTGELDVGENWDCPVVAFGSVAITINWLIKSGNTRNAQRPAVASMRASPQVYSRAGCLVLAPRRLTKHRPASPPFTEADVLLFACLFLSSLIGYGAVVACVVAHRVTPFGGACEPTKREIMVCCVTVG